MSFQVSRQAVAIAGLLSVAVAAAPPVQAQEGDEATGLEEILVTAAYREQGLQDVPVSVSAVTGDMMADIGIQRMEDVQFQVPNFSMTETGISTNIFIRGIGSGINQGFEQSVGTYIDGVYYGRAQQARMPFLDLERIEVLRGPQSILFGKNSVAGALNISTAAPTREFEGSLLVSNEFEHDELIIEGVLSGSLADNVRGRIAARSRQLDGYMYNATLDTDEPDREDWTVRGTLEFDVADNIVATLKAEIGEFDVNGRHIEVVNEQPVGGGPFQGLRYNEILLGVFGQDSSVSNVVQDEVRSSNGDFSFNESETFSLTLDWRIGEHTLESITAQSNFEYNESCDCDFTGAVIFNADLQESYEQFSQEFRLSSPLGDTYDYIAGVYYQTSDHDYADQVVVAANSVLVPAINGQAAGTPLEGGGNWVAGTQAARMATVENDVLSAFAQFNWHINDDVTLQLGGRITKDERDGYRTLEVQTDSFGSLPAEQVAAPLVYAALFGISSTNLVNLGPTGAFYLGALGAHPVSGSRDKTKFSPDVKLVWNVNDDTMLYLSAARGFKSGSFDFRANNRNFYDDMATSFEFEDEENTNIELGGKFTLAGGAAEINTALFSTDFDDLQISIFDGVLGFNVGNAATAEIFGLEVDGRWAANDYLTISGGFSVTDFEFIDFRNGQCYVGQSPNIDINVPDPNDPAWDPTLCDYTGKSNQMLSDFQANLNFDFAYPLARDMELRALVNMFHTGDYDSAATFDPAGKQDAYSMYNLRLGVGPNDGSWEIAVLGKNLSDEKVLQYLGDVPLAGSSFGAKSNYAFFSRGRTLTLQGVVRF